MVRGFSDLRPTSLSSSTNKIIYWVLHSRMVKVLPKIILPNQSGFVKGRNIAENILLAQELIKDINKK